MRFAVVGGDRRSELLCALLQRDGHRVQSFALEKAALPETVPKAGCLQSCVYGADCVVLPTPAEKSGLLNAPLSEEALKAPELIASLWKGQLLCGGAFSEACRQAAQKGGLVLCDLMDRPDFVVGNAAITAEGALSLLMGAGERTLWGSRVLVTGWGRIGRILARRLAALGAEVTVAARRSAHRAEAWTLGLNALDYAGVEGEIGDYDYIVNTVPARVLTEAMLCCAAADAVLLELASPPGGFDKNLAENIGLRVLSAPGLPGKYAPLAAAQLMRGAVYAALREQKE